VLDVERAQTVLGEVRRLTEDSRDTLQCRIDAVLDKMASVELCVLASDEPVTVDAFLAGVEASCRQATATLNR